MDEIELKNSPEALQQQIKTGQIPMRRVWGMLALRPGFSFALLLLTALSFRVAGNPAAFRASSAWWLWFVTITNIVCITLLLHFAKKEGLSWRQMIMLNRSTFKGDLKWSLLFMAGAGIFAMLPGTLMAKAIWNDVNVPNTMLLQSLPVFAMYPLILLMPVTQGLAELTVYWGYVGTRLKARGLHKWVVIFLVGLVLSLQHMFFSFQLDLRYDLWLAFKFFPFALWTGFIMDRRPTTLPYLILLHMLMDASLPIMTLLISKGVLIF